MSRSRRKTTKKPSGKTGSTAAKQASAAFATAHRFADTPDKGKTPARRAKPAAAEAAASAERADKTSAAPEQATAAGRAAEADEATRAAEAAERSDAAERASPAAGEPLAATDRPSGESLQPAGGPSAAEGDERGRAEAEQAAASEARATVADPALAEAAEANERPGAGADPYAHATTGPGAGAGQLPPAYQSELPPEQDEHERSGFAAIALGILVGIIAVAALTLWLAPKVAPHVPAGIARYLAPGQVAVEDRLAELEARIGEERDVFAERTAAIDEERAAAREERATLTGEIDRLQARLEELSAELAETGPDEEALARVETAAQERAALGERIAGLQTGLENMRSEIAAMNQALAEAEEGDGPTNPELAAALAQLQSRVESLASDLQAARAGTDEQIAGLAQRLDETAADLSARLDQALDRTAAAESARAEAEAEAERASAAAALREALTTLEARFAAGEPYAEPLDEIETLSGTQAPDALAVPAETGVPGTAALIDELPRVAREALAAAPRREAADGPFAGATAWLRGQITGRPTVETAGESVGAILSRVEARLEEGAPRAALAEAETLPEPSREAIAEWLDRLAVRAAAEQALAEWRAGLSAAG